MNSGFSEALNLRALFTEEVQEEEASGAKWCNRSCLHCRSRPREGV
jgi:hypothetical protein